MSVNARQYLCGIGLALALAAASLPGFAQDADPAGPPAENAQDAVPVASGTEGVREKAIEPEPPPDRATIKKRFEEARVSLEAVDADVKEVLMDISKQADIPIIVDPEVSGKITLRLKQMLFKDVFQTVLKLSKCTYETKNGLYIVFPRPDLTITMVRKRPVYNPPSITIYRDPIYTAPVYPVLPPYDGFYYDSRVWINGQWVPSSYLRIGGYGFFGGTYQHILSQPTVPFADRQISIDQVVIPRKRQGGR